MGTVVESEATKGTNHDSSFERADRQRFCVTLLNYIYSPSLRFGLIIKRNRYSIRKRNITGNGDAERIHQDGL